MSSLRDVPVFYLDQEESWSTPVEVITRDEARRRKSIGTGYFINHGRAFRLKTVAPPPPISYKPGPLEIGSTITVSEIEANVGITHSAELGEPPNRAAVSRAQEKIRAYPFVFDELAALARGSWAIG